MDTNLPQWLDAAVQAAGITTIYTADDWDRIALMKPESMNDEAANDPSMTQH